MPLYVMYKIKHIVSVMAVTKLRISFFFRGGGYFSFVTMTRWLKVHEI